MSGTYYKLVYRWQYEPKDLFKGKHNLNVEPYTIYIEEGKIIAEVYNTSNEHQLIIQAHAEDYFRAASVISGFAYKIDKDVDIEAYNENGEKLPILFLPSSGDLSVASSIKLRDKLQEEEKQQIIEEEKVLGEFFMKYYYAEDPIIRFIYEYYKASLSQERFLIYLHDIKEAIKTFLRDSGCDVSSDNKLSKEIGLHKAVLNIIWKLANNEIKQGRHPGKYYHEDKGITPSEKAEAKQAAQKMMLAFFKKLRNEPKLVERLNPKDKLE